MHCRYPLKRQDNDLTKKVLRFYFPVVVVFDGVHLFPGQMYSSFYVVYCFKKVFVPPENFAVPYFNRLCHCNSNRTFQYIRTRWGEVEKYIYGNQNCRSY